MHWLWIPPAVVALAGLGVLAGVLRRVVEELQGLRNEARHLLDLRGDLDEVQRLTRRAAVRTRTLSLPSPRRGLED